MKLIKIENDLVVRRFKFVKACRGSGLIDATFDNCLKNVESCHCCAYSFQCTCVGIVISKINLIHETN